MARASRLVVGLVLCVLAVPRPSLAWNGRGHMMVAAVAYDHLTPAARARADAVLKLNPSYHAWLKTIPTKVKGAARRKAVFMIAATWPDQIKRDRRYTADGTQGGDRAPAGPAASQNIGYTDRAMHRYWHFVDTPFGSAGLELPPIPEPNAEDRIPVFLMTLRGDAPDTLKSYDLSWLLHLIGDVHQPLHASTRVAAGRSGGDNGGNAIKICPATGCARGSRVNWHSTWDDILGTSTSVTAAMKAAAHLPAADAQQAQVLDVGRWAHDSFELAQTDVYRAPIDETIGPFTLTTTYTAHVRAVAQRQIALAGARLAVVLNRDLK